MPSRLPRSPVAVDDADRALLAALLTDPGLGVAALAARTGISPASTSRRLARLRRTGVLRVVGRTAPGFGDRTVRMTRVSGPPGDLTDAAGRLRHRAGVTWARFTADGTELLVGTGTRRGEADPVLGPGGIGRGLRTRVHELLRVWTAQPTVLTPPASLDPLDLRVLDALGEDGRLTSAELGRRLGVDATTAARRRQRLEREGVLYLEATVDPSALGAQGDVMFWLTVRPGAVGATGERLRALPEARFVAATSGVASLVATMSVPAGRVVEFVDEALAGDGVHGVEVVPLRHTRAW